ncbi:MAG: hypothetical protein QOJ54_3600 [Aliidongia sp.]|jgi:hypothetical protein|nr:hypothetical protein [Aliidongia sp.]
MLNLAGKVVAMVTQRDDVASLKAKIETVCAEGLTATAEIERIDAAIKAPGNREAFKDLKRQRAEQEENAEYAAGELVRLQAQLATAKVLQDQRAFARHDKAIRALYPKLRAAMIAAGRVQAEVIAAREAACAEVGEGIVNSRIPFFAYRGLVLDEFIKLWTDDTDRVLAAPVAKPRPVPAVKPPTPPPIISAMTPHGIRLDELPPPLPPKPVREPAPPPAQGEVRVVICNGNVTDTAGTAHATGATINLRAEQARALALKGMVEIVAVETTGTGAES